MIAGPGQALRNERAPQLAGRLTVSVLMGALFAACGSSTSRDSPVRVTATLYDDFSSGSISATKWNQGQRRAVLSDQAALLSHSMSELRPNTGYATELLVRPPTSGVVTTLGTEIQVTISRLTGDSSARSGIEILFQPIENRIGPDLTNALLARIVLSNANGGLAQRQLFECTSADCSSFTSIGTPTGNWPGAGLPVSTGTAYTISISIDTTAKEFRFAISGGAYGVAKATTIHTAAVTSPFPVDVSSASFLRARLFAMVRGGAAGGGDGSLTAQFDNVNLAMNGGPASLFDDFKQGTSFDSTKWTVGKESAQIVESGLQFILRQEDVAASVPMDLASPDVSVFQADVTVTHWSMVGHGRIVARIEAALYNDGTTGSGSPPDINRPGSQVGDVLAIINMGQSHLWYDVVRCDSPNCSHATYIRAAGSLGAVTLGSTHTLLIQWDEPNQKILFQIDNNLVATFDPVAAGYSIAGAPNQPMRRIAVRAWPTAPAATFTGSLEATFDNVKTM